MLVGGVGKRLLLFMRAWTVARSLRDRPGKPVGLRNGRTTTERRSTLKKRAAHGMCLLLMAGKLGQTRQEFDLPVGS